MIYSLQPSDYLFYGRIIPTPRTLLHIFVGVPDALEVKYSLSTLIFSRALSRPEYRWRIKCDKIHAGVLISNSGIFLCRSKVELTKSSISVPVVESELNRS